MGERKTSLRGGPEGKSLWQKIVDVSLSDVATLVKGIDEDAIEELERILLEADFGVDVTVELLDELERAARRGQVRTEAELRDALAGKVRAILRDAGGGEAPAEGPPGPDFGRRPRAAPFVILLLGVNGTGKTTTAAKLARRASTGGLDVVLAATDTFRSGAQEQLRIWARRLGTGFIGGESGGDPAAVAYAAAEAAVARSADVLILDTAGRLHTQRDLMRELQKIDRVTARLVEGAPHERFLVVDATAGQNVLNQVLEFGKGLPLTGIVLAKYDSSARGGTAVAVSRRLGVTIRYLGTGEQADDLQPFDPEVYVEKLLS